MTKTFSLLLGVFLLLSSQLWGQAACDAPLNISLVTREATAATFSWSPVNGVTGYEVSWREVGATTWNEAKTPATIYTISNLNPSTVYEMRLRSECEPKVYSNYANTFMFATQEQGSNTCDIPTNFNVSRTTSNSCTINWQPVTGAASYEVSYRPVSSSNWTNTVNVASTGYTITGLNPNTDYEVSVRTVCNNSVSSAYAKPARFTTPSENNTGDCPAPTNLRVSEIDDNSASLEWSATSTVWFYEISYRREGSSYWNLAFTTGNARRLIFLQPGTTYEVRVRAICDWGSYSDYTTTQMFTTPERSSECAAPTNVRVKEVDGYIVRLEWDNNGNNPYLYEMQYRRVNTNFWIPFFSTSTTGSILLFSKDEEYEVRVRAICNWGFESDFSTIITVSSTTNNPNCPNPQNLAVNNITANSAGISWAPVPNAIGYSIRYRSFDNWNWTTANTSQTSFPLSGLSSFRSYEWQVRANCTAESGNWSRMQIFTTINGRMGEMEATDNSYVQIFPNPNQGMFVASYMSEGIAPVTFTVVDLSGKVVFQQSFDTAAGINEFPVRLDNTAPGMYILKAQSGNQLTQRKFILN